MGRRNKHIYALLDSVKTLYDGGKYSDLTIVSSKKTYRVHKAIICPRSTFFARSCDGGFEGARTGVIDLPQDDPHAVEVMVHFLYHLDYPKTLPSFDATDSAPPQVPPINLAVHARVFSLAEMYGVADLKDVALQKFRDDASTRWEAGDFLLAAEIAYVETANEVRELRTAVLEVFLDHLPLLESQACKDVFSRLPDLSYDMLLRSHGMGDSDDMGDSDGMGDSNRMDHSSIAQRVKNKGRGRGQGRFTGCLAP